MLDLSTAVLCDFAQVRDRLLFVSSGAVSRLYRQELPAPLGMMVGLVIEVPLEDAGMDHRLRAEVINRHGTVLATLENLFRVSDAGLFPHEVQQVPLVLSITGVRARTWGTHQVRLYLDEELVRALTLYVVPAAGPQAVVRATPTQSRVADDEGTLGGTGTDGVPDELPTEAPAEEPAAAGSEPEPVEWGAPEPADDEPATDDEPADDEAPDSSTLVIALDEPAPLSFDLDLSDEPAVDDAPTDEASEAPDVDPALTFTLDPEPQPEPEAPPSWGGTATIDAPTAAEPEPLDDPHVFDFDEDDLDADPADRERSVTTPDTATEPQAEPSRFAFRYRYDDDENT